MLPVAVTANQPDTFYRGSGRLAAFRAAELPPRPEDWIASTTARFGQAPNGLTVLPDGRTLVEAVTAEPRDWLGDAHLSRYGRDTALLVKLLDAGQRLPLHVHPSRSFAHSHLASPYGKTEAWIVVDAAPDAYVHLGFNRDVTVAELAQWVSTQDRAAMLAATNRVPVVSGDTLLCPAGMPHAIGENILLIELQEPTDFSVLLEWEGFGLGPADATLGLPFDVALACVDRRACRPERLAALRGGRSRAPEGDRLLPVEADEFFSAVRVGPGPLPRGFGILIVTAGAGGIDGDWGSLPIRRGTTVALPYAAGDCTLTGNAAGILCRPAEP